MPPGADDWSGMADGVGRRAFAVAWRTVVALLSASALTATAVAWTFQQHVESNLVTSSVLVFGVQITPLQILGYAIALGGLVLFKTSGSK